MALHRHCHFQGDIVGVMTIVEPRLLPLIIHLHLHILNHTHRFPMQVLAVIHLQVCLGIQVRFLCFRRRIQVLMITIRLQTSLHRPLHHLQSTVWGH